METEGVSSPRPTERRKGSWVWSGSQSTDWTQASVAGKTHNAQRPPRFLGSQRMCPSWIVFLKVLFSILLPPLVQGEGRRSHFWFPLSQALLYLSQSVDPKVIQFFPRQQGSLCSVSPGPQLCSSFAFVPCLQLPCPGSCDSKLLLLFSVPRPCYFLPPSQQGPPSYFKNNREASEVSTLNPLCLFCQTQWHHCGTPPPGALDPTPLSSFPLYDYATSVPLSPCNSPATSYLQAPSSWPVNLPMTDWWWRQWTSFSSNPSPYGFRLLHFRGILAFIHPITSILIGKLKDYLAAFSFLTFGYIWDRYPRLLFWDTFLLFKNITAL